MQSLKIRLKRIVDEAVLRGVAPSISLFAGFDVLPDAKDIIIHGGQTHSGFLTNNDTLYDLASLTKIIATAPITAKAISKGLISLKERPFKVFPNLKIEKILSHEGGFPAHLRFYEKYFLEKNQAKIKDLIIQEILSLKLLENNKRLYSDIGFISLGYLLEKRFKRPLNLLFEEILYEIDQNSDIKYNINCKSDTKLFYNIAPTGYCNFRKKYLRAEVNDSNSYLMGGISAHAGLFGGLNDVAKIARFFLRIHKNPQTIFEEELSYFTKHHLAFNFRDSKGSTSAFSNKAFGHFGFTGTSLWIEPAKNLTVIILSNRVQNGEDRTGIFRLRKAVHDIVSGV